jgi:hypothetical protein
MTYRSATHCERVRGRGYRIFTALWAIAGCLSSRGASADPIDLRWEAPANCPQAAAVQRQLQALTGELGARRGSVRADGRVEVIGDRYRLTLRLREGADARERTIESDSCVDLAGAAAVSLGIFLRHEPEPDAGAAAPPERSGGTGVGSGVAPGDRAAVDRGDANGLPQQAEPVSAPKMTPATTPAVDGSDDEISPSSETEAIRAKGKRNWEVLLRAPFGGVDLGMVPKPGLAIGLGAGLRYEEWRVLALGSVFRDQRVLASLTDAVGVEVERARAELGLCRGWRTSRWEVAPCLTLSLDHLTVTGVGVGISPRPRRTSVITPGLSAVAHLYLADWLAIAAGVSGGVRLSRPHLSVDGFGEVYQLGAYHLGFTLGPEWIF